MEIPSYSLRKVICGEFQPPEAKHNDSPRTMAKSFIQSSLRTAKKLRFLQLTKDLEKSTRCRLKEGNLNGLPSKPRPLCQSRGHLTRRSSTAPSITRPYPPINWLCLTFALNRGSESPLRKRVTDAWQVTALCTLSGRGFIDRK